MDRYLFSDEAGDFTFNRNQNVSRFFIICTVCTSSLEIGQALGRLRHQMLWEGLPLGDCFHATTDAQAVRDRVFALLAASDFTFQATICEKSKAQPQVRESRARFYKYPWYYHFKHGISAHLREDDQLVVTTASIGTKKEKQTFVAGLQDVIQQSASHIPWRVDFRPALSDPLLQVADYCAWAMQRKWERSDERSLDLIRGKLTYEYDLWARGARHYY